MKTLRRGSKAYYKDLYDDWRACTVLRVSGSGSPSREIMVQVRMDVGFNAGWSESGAVLEVESVHVVPSTAIEFMSYGGVIKSQYVCQETYPDRRKNVEKI